MSDVSQLSKGQRKRRVPNRIIVKSVHLDGIPHSFWIGGTDAAKRPTDRVRKRAVWEVVMDGRKRRMVTTLERGQQERELL